MKWQYVLCQHPMYLLIEEDSKCAERTPPWGAQSIDEYIDRLRRNLDKLKQYPQLKINFDFSAIEIKRLASRAPEVIEAMRNLVTEGRIGFVNGTYSQPHLQNFGSESNWRQFELGLKTIEELVGYKVDTYAAQEVGLNEQLPQILSYFGYKFAALPGFSYAISFLNEHELIGYGGRLDFVQDEEFTSWLGIGGQEIPLYLLNVSAGCTDNELTLENQKDLFHSPIIRAEFPDMIEIDDKWVAARAKNAEFVLLDKALTERIKKCPPKSKARLYTYWSYVEGVSAEELGRMNKEAEVKAIQAEAINVLASLLGNEPIKNFTPLWEEILESQHHDAYWAGGPELREKAIAKLKEVISKCERLATDSVAYISPRTADIVVFNTYPLACKDLVKVHLNFSKGEVKGIKLYNNRNEEEGFQILDNILFEDGSIKECSIAFLSEVDGLGYKSYRIEKIPNTQINVREEPIRIKGDVTIENEFYKAVITPSGLFKSLYLKSLEEEILNTSEYYGNELKAQLPNGEWVTNINEGKEAYITRGPLITILEVHGRLGNLETETQIFFYKNLPRIDFQLEINFEKTSLGTYWNDESKLNLYWPLNYQGEIYHDIAFGVIKGRQNRPLFAINWLDFSDGEKGFSYMNKGTPKCWVKNSTIANILAWGGEGNQFTNRMMQKWVKELDLRLDGKQTFYYSIYPHKGTWQEAGVPIIAKSYSEPLLGFQAQGNGNDVLPPEISLFTFQSANIIPTSIQRTEEGLKCRFYETFGKLTELQLKLAKEWQVSQTIPLKKVLPFQIFEIEIKKTK